jgi:hypothetical protein
MQQQLSPSDDHSPRHLARRLNRVFGEINVFLLALAIGLTVLDATCLVTLSASNEIARRQQSPISTEPSPSPSGPIEFR